MSTIDSRNDGAGRGSNGEVVTNSSEHALTVPPTEMEKLRVLAVLFPKASEDSTKRPYDAYRNELCLEMAMGKGDVADGIEWLNSYSGKRADLIHIVTEEAKKTYSFVKKRKELNSEEEEEASLGNAKKARKPNKNTKKENRTGLATLKIKISALERQIMILVSFFTSYYFLFFEGA